MQDECKLGLVHKWQATSLDRTGRKSGSPFPSGMAVCACIFMAVQCPDASSLWDLPLDGGLTPSDVAAQSSRVMAWKGPEAVAAGGASSCLLNEAAK